MLNQLLAASHIAQGDSTLLYKMKKLGLLRDIWKADLKKLRALFVGSDRIEELERLRESLNLEEVQDVLKKNGYKVFSVEDALYPSLLKEIYQPPLLLYVWGDVKTVDHSGVAVVGTRKPTMYGLRHTRSMCKGLVSSGLTVVSGLAIGLDSHAHKSTLEASGRTIAVIAGGLDVALTDRQKLLVDKIISGLSGAIITEYPLGLKPRPYHFPIRNRIIAGISRATVVIEGDVSSGSLITAANANEFGRLVFALPGSVDSSKSHGPHALVKKGTALLVENVEDVLEELKVDYIKPVDSLNIEVGSAVEKAVLEALSTEPLHTEEIIVSTGEGVSDIHATLTIMHLKGMIEPCGGGRWVRTS